MRSESIIIPRRQVRLSVSALRRLIDHACISAKGWEFEISRHAERDHPERGLVAADIVLSLYQKNWTLEIAEYKNGPRYFGWVYKIKATTYEDREITILATVNPKRKRVKFVTRW